MVEEISILSGSGLTKNLWFPEILGLLDAAVFLNQSIIFILFLFADIANKIMGALWLFE